MKVLLTGATGFLGKQVLRLLIDDREVSEIHAVSRTMRSHPNSKVKVHQIDLSEAGSVQALQFLDSSFHRVIHLAGLYDFNADMRQNYTQNVLPILHLISRLKFLKTPVPVVMASTFAVSVKSKKLEEAPLQSVPSSDLTYPYTKALAEQSLVESGIPAFIFRLGVIVGDSKRGAIEKIDGPYYLLRVVDQIQNGPLKKFFRILPIPAKPSALLPIVPVDFVAQAFHRSLYKEIPTQKFYSIFRNGCVSASEFVTEVLSEMNPSMRPIFIDSAPEKMIYLQKFITHIPPAVFDFARSTTQHTNLKFLADFPEIQIPDFSDYKKQFVEGFLRFQRGEAS